MEAAADKAAYMIFEVMEDENEKVDAVEAATVVALMWYKVFNMSRDVIGLERAQEMLKGTMDAMRMTYEGGFNSKYQEKDEADCRD